MINCKLIPVGTGFNDEILKEPLPFEKEEREEKEKVAVEAEVVEK